MVRTAKTTSPDAAFARYEHKQLKAELDEIRTVAETVGRLGPTEVVRAVGRLREWLATTLGPHLTWEDVVVYPEIDRVAAAELATSLMRFEHHQIQRLGAILDSDIATLRAGPVTHEQVCEMRAHLLGLETMLRTHIEKEEALLLPYLDNSDRR
jgi:iron-sulfur cluster repair protein YtfE (RIC family)